MDTRLLRVWSNWLGLGRGFNTTFLFFFIALSASLGTNLPAFAQGKEEPVTQVRLHWNAAAKKFNAQQYLSLPMSWLREDVRTSDSSSSRRESVAVDFWILPNRDLLESTQQRLTREQREFKNAAPTIEWPFTDAGLGVLSVRNVVSAVSSTPCPAAQDAFAEALSKLSWLNRTFEKHNLERHLRIDIPDNQVAQCVFLRISFDFEPRLGEGNFALKDDDVGHFSGPIFPLLKRQPVSSRILFQQGKGKLTMSCSGCRAEEGGQNVVDFFGLSPVLHFAPEELEAENILRISDVKLNTGSLKASRSDDEELLRGVQIFYEALQGAFLREKQEGENFWQVMLHSRASLERLVIEQVGEIQLHSSYGHVNPILTSYHRAALFRALARDFLRSVLARKPLATWDVQGENEIVARVLAEIWLQKAFPKLNNLKELSDKLDFLPFFRAIQQGNAFLNNSVFVGSEERRGDLDFSIFHEFFAPASGAELLLRVKSCASPADFDALHQLAVDAAQGKISVYEFKVRLKTLNPVAGCRTPMRAGLLPDFFPEENIEIVEDNRKLSLRRKVIETPPTFEFFFTANKKLPRETLKIAVSDAKEGERELVVPSQDSAEEIVSLPDSVNAARVLSPHPAVNSERLTWPRPLRTVLQALSLNYDSRRTDLVLRSQLQTTQTGDEWGRALTVGYRREYAQNNLDLQFLTRLPSIVPETSASFVIAATTRIQKAPPTFVATSYALESGRGSVLYPEGMGLRLWLRRPLSLAALKEKMADPAQEWIFHFNAGLAPRLTWSEIISYGSSETEVDVGLRSVPAWPTEEYTSKEYALVRSELRHTLTQNLNASLAKSLLFQHALLYGAHVFAFDRLRAESTARVDARVAQSLVMGFRLYGALFGAKDQAVSFEIARALTDPARTSFGFSLGKALN